MITHMPAALLFSENILNKSENASHYFVIFLDEHLPHDFILSQNNFHPHDHHSVVVVYALINFLSKQADPF